MESSQLNRRESLEDKIPELGRTVDMVKVLIDKRDHDAQLETTFELSDTLYAKGVVERVDHVYVWLGVESLPLLFRAVSHES